jgi:DNA (cytosine-5)-methyltransferase 1
LPDDFELVGSYEQQWARIGNSVPPLMMKAVADHVRENILFAPWFSAEREASV